MSFENIDVQALKVKIENLGDAIILDVRSEAELEEGFIEGHTMINFNSPDFEEEVEKLDKSKTYYVYCRSGGRSARACELMESLGFEKLYNVLGGINAWNQL
jgi:rhodanese-related sulfurtransferase